MSGPELLLNVPVMGWQQISSSCHLICCAAEQLCNVIPFLVQSKAKFFICLVDFVNVCKVNLIRVLN